MDRTAASLETLFENYRELEKQEVSLKLKTVGIVILLFICFCLLMAHYYFMPMLLELQFQNWFVLSLFAFITQVFLVDTMLYIGVAIALKRLVG